MNYGLALGVLASILALGGRARAEESRPDTPSAAAPVDDFAASVYVTGGLGYLNGLDGPGAVVIDLLALKRFGPLALGGNLQVGSALLSNHYASTGPSIGLFLPTPRWLEVGIVGTVGIRGYSGFSRHPNLFSDDPGASALVGFASARGIIAWAIRTTKTSRLSLGVQGLVDDDLGRTKQSYSYSDKGPLLGFSGSASQPRTVAAAETVGVLRVGAMLALGASF